MEFIELFKNEVIVAATLAIVELLKSKNLLKGKTLFKVIKLDDYKLVSLVVSAILIIVVKHVLLSENTVLFLDNAALLVLPSLGYDYLYKPFVKPILNLFGESEVKE
jgi:hypothetical protein